MLGAVWVQAGEKTVFPVAVEPIVRQDGCEKNDCERNAAKRLVPQIRQVLPTEKVLITFDALYANAPLIRLLKEHRLSYLIGIKERLCVHSGGTISQTKQIERSVLGNERPIMLRPFLLTS